MSGLWVFVSNVLAFVRGFQYFNVYIFPSKADFEIESFSKACTATFWIFVYVSKKIGEEIFGSEVKKRHKYPPQADFEIETRQSSTLSGF